MLHLQRIPPRLSVLTLQCDSPRRHVFLAVLVDRPFLAILALVHIAPLGKQAHPVENNLLPTTPVQDHSLKYNQQKQSNGQRTVTEVNVWVIYESPKVQWWGILKYHSLRIYVMLNSLLDCT